jgi:putative NADPH-quinone reductase
VKSRPRHIAIIQGHPDSTSHHFVHALAAAYADGAHQGRHEVRMIDVGQLDFPLLRTKQDWESDMPAHSIRQAQTTIAWADHLVILYPLWLGSMPALLKAFLEQVFRPGFAIVRADAGNAWKKLLTGKSARIVVTMGMPAFVYRWYFRAHSLKSLERNILRFCGIGPLRESLIGMIETSDKNYHAMWIDKMRALGRDGG